MLLGDILIKKRGIILFPKCGMFFFESFQNGFHDCFPEEFRFVLHPVSVAIYAQSPHFPVIEHQRETICPS